MQKGKQNQEKGYLPNSFYIHIHFFNTNANDQLGNRHVSSL